MKRYFWKEIINKSKSIVSVYQQMKDGSFYHIDSIESNRGSYRGGKAVAYQILHDEFNYKWSEPYGHTHYYLKRNDIILVSLPWKEKLW